MEGIQIKRKEKTIYCSILFNKILFNHSSSYKTFSKYSLRYLHAPMTISSPSTFKSLINDNTADNTFGLYRKTEIIISMNLKIIKNLINF